MPRTPVLPLVATLSLVLFALVGRPAAADTFYVYYLGGQSNMDGYGQVEELPEELAADVEGAYIFHGNTVPDSDVPVEAAGRGSWQPLRPGHGVGFMASFEKNAYSGRFGVELTFGRRLRELHPDRKIAIIKYSRGGTSLDPRSPAAPRAGCWAPGDAAKENARYNQYDHALATIRNALASRDVDGDGELDTLIPAGMVWMQGESDGMDRESALAYTNNLRRLFALLRAALHDDRLPAAIGLISDSGMQPAAGEDGKIWEFGDLVRVAQGDVSEMDARATLVTSTDEYGYSDAAHYDSAGYIDLGRQFADALEEFEDEAEGED